VLADPGIVKHLESIPPLGDTPIRNGAPSLLVGALATLSPTSGRSRPVQVSSTRRIGAVRTAPEQRP
jgi:hypothetical protein